MKTCIDRMAVLSRFAEENESEISAIAAYSQFVTDGLEKDITLGEIKGDLILGDRGFVESVKDIIEKEKNNLDYPKYQRTAFRPDLEELLDPLTVSMKETRNVAVRKAYNEFGYTQSYIARFLGVHNSTIYRIIRK